SFKVENAETIEILGLNSDWENSVIMSRKKDGSFSADVNLPKDSTHEFKYLVDQKEWLNEPEADKEVPNVYGGSNSVITL
ncbi:MAG: isoamylase early set domain-containing protein, partial [Chitinophagaceae bacterium]|nr:isoamylase early set domain-containing protein [Chitinophagaceae bacterium]